MADYTTIKKPLDYFNTKLYSGSNGTQNVTGVGFQPDWTWLKCRSTAYHHRIFDAVRGVNKNIRSNSSDAEQNIVEGITAFASDGFSVTQGSNLEYNASGQTYVSWNWKGNGAGSSNSDGDITSTVSANTTAGFSVVKFTANGTNNGTIGHGLGAAPKIIFYKRTDSTGDWFVVYKFVDGSLDFMKLNANDAKQDLTLGTYGFSTSTTITNLGFTNSHEMIAYCFAEKRGYSKIGSYTGNNNSDGAFVYTGFRPAWGMFKKINSNGDWLIMDDVRNGGYRDQPLYKIINANSTAAEASSYASYKCDFVSNGFKIRNTLGNQNASGTYLFMAFAELPLVGDNPATAR